MNTKKLAKIGQLAVTVATAALGSPTAYAGVAYLVGSGFQCWDRLSNGSYVMNPDRCRSVSGLKLREGEVVTGPDGVAQVPGWRLFSYPSATFRVEEVVGGDRVVKEFKVYPQPWSLAAVTSFAAMVSAMVMVLRRGVW